MPLSQTDIQLADSVASCGVAGDNDRRHKFQRSHGIREAETEQGADDCGAAGVGCAFEECAVKLFGQESTVRG